MARTKREVPENQNERFEASSSDSSVATAVVVKQRLHHRADYWDRLGEQLADLDDALQDQKEASGVEYSKLRLVDANVFEHIPRRGEEASYQSESAL